MQAVYERYKSAMLEDFGHFEDAKNFLRVEYEEGHIYPIGIFDGKTLYLRTEVDKDHAIKIANELTLHFEQIELFDLD